VCVCVCVCVCVLGRVAISSSRGSSQPRDRTQVSCISYIGRCILYHSLCHLGSPTESGALIKFCALGSSFSPTSLCCMCIKTTFFGFWILLETWMQGVSQPFPHSLFDWHVSLILWDLWCHVIYWKSMLDAGFLHFHHFIFQGWYLNSPPYFIFPMWAKALQSRPTLWDPMDCSPPGSSVQGIFQARTLVWVAISFSRGSSWPRNWTHISCISCIGKRVLYHWCHLGSPYIS